MHTIMDMSVISALLGAQTGMGQVAMALDMVRMNADAGKAVVQMLDAASQNTRSLANVADGVGTKLDVTA